MRLKILDLLVCPKCAELGQPPSRKFTIQGDFNEEKVFDGFIQCAEGHKWQVRDELLKFDKIATEEFLYSLGDIEYGEVDRFPPNISDLETEFVDMVNEAVNVAMGQRMTVAIKGSPILFLEKLDAVDRPIIVINPEEKILRKCQEIAAKNGFFDYLSVVKASRVTFSDPSRIFEVSIISEDDSASLKIQKKDDHLELVRNDKN